MKINKIISVISACSLLLLPSFSVNAADGLPTKAYICGEIGTTSVWSVDNTTIGSIVPEINGDAQYEAEWKVTGDGGATELTFLALSVPNITSDSYPQIDVNVTAVYIDGVEVPNYKMSANAINTAYYEAGRDPETRVYLYDSLKGTNVADLPKVTTIKDSIKVVFTVTGTGQYGTSNIQANVIQTTEASQESTENTGLSETSESSDTTVNTAAVESTSTGDEGFAVAAAAGLVVTAAAAVLSKVKIKRKK